jgi:ribonuclease P protein component
MLEVRVVASPPARLETAGEGRIGLIVPRHRQSAVARNRLKRRLRELSRRRILSLHLGADIVIRARAEAYGASFAELASDVDRIVAQLHRLQSSGSNFQRGGHTGGP